MNEESGVFNLVKDYWQILKVYPETEPITMDNTDAFLMALLEFYSKYVDTPFEKLSYNWALTYMRFRVDYNSEPITMDNADKFVSKCAAVYSKYEGSKQFKKVSNIIHLYGDMKDKQKG